MPRRFYYLLIGTDKLQKVEVVLDANDSKGCGFLLGGWLKVPYFSIVIWQFNGLFNYIYLSRDTFELFVALAATFITIL